MWPLKEKTPPITIQVVVVDFGGHEEGIIKQTFNEVGQMRAGWHEFEVVNYLGGRYAYEGSTTRRLNLDQAHRIFPRTVEVVE
jgi:hypothetical protein